MKQIRLLTTMWIALVFSFSSLSQVKTRVVALDSNVKIRWVNPTENYLCVVATRTAFPYSTAYLFDKSGNKLLEIAGETSGHIMHAEASEQLNYFVVVDGGWGAGPEGPGSDDVIRVHDINNGNVLWRNHWNAATYRVSPNGKYIMTAATAIDKGPGGSKFAIFSVKDGSEIPNELRIADWYADWLDSEHVVLAMQQMRPNPDVPGSYFEEQRRQMMQLEILRDSLVHLRLRYSLELDKGKISKWDYKTKTDQLTKKINELDKEIGEERRARRRGPPPGIPGATKMMIYNILSKKIEIEKDTYAADGDPITVDASSERSPATINVEYSTQEIYFRGYKRNIDMLNEECIVKLDKNLNVLMTSQLGRAINIAKVVVEDEIYFWVKHKEGQFLVDKTTGKLIATQFVETKIGRIDFSLDHLVSQKTFLRDIKIDERKNAIEFHPVREGKQ